jgi:hypothetical protein
MIYRMFGVASLRRFFRVGWTALTTSLKVFQAIYKRIGIGMTKEEIAEDVAAGFFTLPVLLRDADVKDPAVHKNAPRALRKHVRSHPTPLPVERMVTRQQTKRDIEKEEKILAFHQLMDPTLPPTEWAKENFLTSPLASDLQAYLVETNLPSSVQELIKRDQKLVQARKHADRLKKVQLLAMIYAL